MQKAQKNRVEVRIGSVVKRFAILGILFISLTSLNVIRVSTLVITSEDGLELTADEYIIAVDNPYIILFHEQGSSRGEFQSIARRLCKMDYNCLAVDLRNGGNSNYISNESAKRCRERKCSTGSENVEADMSAAIEYALSKTDQPVVLFGCGANGSLSLKLANEHDQVRGVVALSPGEYFQPEINLQDTISNLRKPVFVTSSRSEFPYVSELISQVDEEYTTLFEPQLGEGGRGSASLTTENKYNSEYWLALLLFFKDLM